MGRDVEYWEGVVGGIYIGKVVWMIGRRGGRGEEMRKAWLGDEEERKEGTELALSPTQRVEGRLGKVRGMRCGDREESIVGETGVKEGKERGEEENSEGKGDRRKGGREKVLRMKMEKRKERRGMEC